MFKEAAEIARRMNISYRMAQARTKNCSRLLFRMLQNVRKSSRRLSWYFEEARNPLFYLTKKFNRLKDGVYIQYTIIGLLQLQQQLVSFMSDYTVTACSIVFSKNRKRARQSARGYRIYKIKYVVYVARMVIDSPRHENPEFVVLALSLTRDGVSASSKASIRMDQPQALPLYMVALYRHPLVQKTWQYSRKLRTFIHAQRNKVSRLNVINSPYKIFLNSCHLSKLLHFTLHFYSRMCTDNLLNYSYSETFW